MLDMVKSRVGTVIAYLTRCTLNKPWCAAEITIALMTTKCKVLAVQTPSFLPPDEEDLSDLSSYLDLQCCNFEHYGITTVHIASVFGKLMDGQVVTMVDAPVQIKGIRHFEVLAGMIDATVATSYEDLATLPKLQPQSMTGKLVISSDGKCDETTALVCLLKLKLQPALTELIPSGICCLCDHAEDPRLLQESMSSVRAVVVVLSSGTLASSSQLNVAAWAAKARSESGAVDVIPVSIPGFVFPTEEFFSSAVPKMCDKTAKLGFSDATEYTQALREFFCTSRTTLSTRERDQVFDQEVHDLLARMRRGPRRTTIRMSVMKSKTLSRQRTPSRRP